MQERGERIMKGKKRAMIKRSRAAFCLTTTVGLVGGILLVQATFVGCRPMAAHPLLHLEQRGAATLQTRLPPHGGFADYSETDETDPHRRPPPRQRRKRKSPIQSFAEQSLKLTTKTALGTVKQSGKAAYYLVKPKHVEKQELIGLWRLDQQVQRHANDPVPIECSANIELTPTSVLVTIASENDDDDDDQILKTPWKFKPARWPRAAKVEFVARAFSSSSTGRPKLFFYKGQVDRKLAARSIIKIKGKIYRIEKTGWRGKTVKHVAVGTFVARRRMQLVESAEEDDDHDEDSDWESDEEDMEDGDEVQDIDEEELSDEGVSEDEEEEE